MRRYLVEIDSLTMPDGERFAVGDSVRHKDGWIGSITMITAPSFRSGAIKLRVKPDKGHEDACQRSGMCWPKQGGGKYVQARDSGMTLQNWEKI